MGTNSSLPPKPTSMSKTSGRTSSPFNGDAQSPPCGGTRGPQRTPPMGSDALQIGELSEPAAGLNSPLTTTGGPAVWGEDAGDSPKPPTEDKELPSLCEGAPSSEFSAGEAEVAGRGPEGAPRYPSPEAELTLAYGSEDLERQLDEFFDSPEPEAQTSGSGPEEALMGWAEKEDDALRASVAGPDAAPVTVGGGDFDKSGSTLVGNGEGTGNTACSVEEGYSVSVFPNGTIAYTPVARSESGAVRPDDDLKGPPGTASRVRKRSRKERQEEEKDESEVEVIEVAPKRQRVQAPPLMPKDKFCLVFPQPAGFPCGGYFGVKIESPEFFREHLPVDSVEEAEKVVKWWRQEWEDKASNLTYLMGLSWKTDPAGSAKRLIRYAQPLCDRMHEELGSEYYDRLLNSEKKKFYGHVYFRMCKDVHTMVEAKWRREEEAAIKSKALAAASVTQLRKRKSSGDDGEEDAPVASEKKKQKKAKAPAERLGVDGKIVHQRGIMRGAGKLEFGTEERRDAMEALQKRLFDEAAGH
ncbi:hypothetical protein TWF594_005789 [Orbilia oligospora]|nr:hypothetical protein TWF706_006699 [Orbilia oligospora]KAF3117677.1 hypothetical protein TWF103_004358 [Orbilia oligospora]KAF3152034.1 hypothetical protein TWF594_005789 [Orbilia oligospora]